MYRSSPPILQRQIVADIKETVCRVPDSNFDGVISSLFLLYVTLNMLMTLLTFGKIIETVNFRIVVLLFILVLAETSYTNIPTTPYELPDGQ